MTFSLVFALILGTVGQTAATAGAHQTPTARLEFMKASLKVHSVHSLSDPKNIYKLQSEPVMRFTNPVGTVKDGAIFLWTGADSRPEAAVQIFLHNNRVWYQEFSSLSTQPVAADSIWRVNREGVKFTPFPGAPRPAETAELRLRQIRDLAGDFSAQQLMQEQLGDQWHELRILTKPFVRYGKPGTGVIDGVLLACVLTTDPEIYLMIEAREGKDGPEWQFAFTPASIAGLKCQWKKKEVWRLPYREAWTDNTAPYYVWGFSQEP
jgi:hypothetical protein